MKSEKLMEQPKYLPIDVKDVDLAFSGPIDKLMPKMEDIPEEFKNFNTHNKWQKFFSDKFYLGLKDLKLYPVEGVDPEKAWRHLCAFTNSWAPKHQHKEAAFAYLASLWFKDVTYETQKKPEDLFK